MIKRRKVLKINLAKGQKIEEDDAVASDKSVNIFVNGSRLITLIASPKNLEELAVGYLFGEGIIRELKDIEEVSRDGFNVYLKLKEGLDLKSLNRAAPVVTSACGSSGDITGLFAEELLDKGEQMLGNTKFKAETILNSSKWLQLNTNIFRKTGGTHAAALFTQNGELKVCMEDVGRHNALDKVLGKGLMEGVDFTKSFLVSTGRLSADMIIKCARAEIPLVASRSVPLESGVLAAEMGGLTLIGFARGSRMNVYTHPERLEFYVSD